MSDHFCSNTVDICLLAKFALMLLKLCMHAALFFSCDTEMC